MAELLNFAVKYATVLSGGWYLYFNQVLEKALVVTKNKILNRNHKQGTPHEYTHIS